MSTSRTRRISTIAAGLVISGATLLGAVPAAQAATASTGDTVQPRETTAPKCITDREDKGTIYTKVWVTNRCKRNYRVKLIMARGADSRCFSLIPGQTRLHESRGASPYLDRITLC
jgi:hypothetical protein